MSQKQLIGGLAVAALGLGVGLALHGCGGDGGASTGGAGTTPPIDASQGLQTDPMVMRVAVQAGVKGFDPAVTTDTYSSSASIQIYEPLYEYHYLKRPFEVIPLTAVGMPAISADRKTWTIKVQPGIKFHDDECFTATGGKGRDLTAQDYVYAWKRVADPAVKSPQISFIGDLIDGLEEWRAAAIEKGRADYAAPVRGLRAVDDHTLEVTLTRPSPQFRYILTMTFMAAVPREAVEYYGEDFLNKAVGTGAYRLAEWTPGSRYVLERNENYRFVAYPSEGEPASSRYPGDAAYGLLADAGKRVPFCTRVEVAIIEEDQPYWLTFQQGRMDRAGIPKDFFQSAIKGGKLSPELEAKGIILRKLADLWTSYRSFNMTHPIFQGDKGRWLRRAITHATNPETTKELFFNGRAEVARTPIPPGLEGYDPDFVSPYQVYDVAKAKAALVKAGYPNGEGLPELVYEMSGTDTTNRQMAELLRDDLAKVGIKLRLEPNTWPAFNQKLDERRAQLFGLAWGADYPDPENYLMLFYGPNASPNGPNHSIFQHAEYDKLYEQMRDMESGPERVKIIHRMRDILDEEGPWAYELHRQLWYLTWPWMLNYKYHVMSVATLKYHRVDTALRSQRSGG